MNYTIIVGLAAHEDSFVAWSHYEHVRTGLGDEFLNDLETRYAAIAQNPFAYSYTDKKCVLRDVALDRFPYVVIYKIQQDHILIISVHNTHKKPLML